MRVLGVLATLVVIAGIVVIFTGALPLGKLPTWLRIPLPKRLDFERMVRIQLRRAEAKAVEERVADHGTSPARA